MAGLARVANALQDRNIAKAQIGALLLRLPEPPPPAGAALGKSGDRRLILDLVACGLLKADDGWNEKHPRTGTSPNPGWFRRSPKRHERTGRRKPLRSQMKAFRRTAANSPSFPRRSRRAQARCSPKI